MNEKRVVAAIVKNPQNEVLLAYNNNWNGFAFPVGNIDDDAPPLGAQAIAALEKDLGRSLPRATAKEMEYVGQYGESSRTGEEAIYHYWVFEVDPGENIDLPEGDQAPYFAPITSIENSEEATWSTRAMTKEMLHHREVAVAVISRLGRQETEYLLLFNQNYNGYFPPAMRVTSEVKPVGTVKRLVRHDFGYTGEVQAVHKAETPDVHYSSRFGSVTEFLFHHCVVEFPGLDIHQPFNPLEACLSTRGLKWRWVTASELADKSGGNNWQPSRTLKTLQKDLMAATGVQTRTTSVRQSEGGISLISRQDNGVTRFLAQYNEGWKGYFLVGGHREEGETFYDCVIREMSEELEITPAQFRVAPQPVYQLKYLCQSRSAGHLTAYHMQLFTATLTEEALDTANANPANRWLTIAEIRRGGAGDGRKVSPTLTSLLFQAGILG